MVGGLATVDANWNLIGYAANDNNANGAQWLDQDANNGYSCAARGAGYYDSKAGLSPQQW